MPNYNFKLTGTKTTGPSIVDDWTDANCYPESRIHSIVEVDGDIYNFDENLAGLGTTTYIASFAWSISKGITVNTRFGANGGGAILSRASGGSLIELSADSTVMTTINDLKFSSDSISFAMMVMSSSIVSKNVTLNRLEFIGASTTAQVISLQQENGTIVINDIVISGIYTASLIYGAATMGANSTVDITIDGVHFNNVIGQSSVGFYGILLRKGNFANAVSTKVRNVTGIVTAANISGAFRAIELQGIDEMLIEYCSHTVVGTATANSAYGILIVGLDAVNRQAINPIVRYNDIKFNCPAGDACSIGADTTIDFMINPRVHDNEFAGLLPASLVSSGVSPHGLTMRGLPSGKAYRNIIHGFHSPLMHSLCTSDEVQSVGNFIYDCYGVIYSYKGNSGGIMANNLAIVTPNSMDGTVTKPYGTWAREQGGTANSAGQSINNSIIYLGMIKPGMFALVDAGDALTLSNNNYYTDQVLPADAFSYQGTDYDTLAAWNVAHEAEATDKKNFSASVAEIIAAFGNLDIDELVANSDTYGGGIKWWTGANPETLGEPLPDLVSHIDQGLQSRNGPLSLKNL